MSKKSGGRKRTKKRTKKADEAFSVGPLQVRRFGRVTELRNTLSPAAFDRMVANFPEHREKLRHSIQAKIDEITLTLTKLSALHLVYSVVRTNCLGVLETHSEPERQGNEAFAEYAQSMAMAIATHGTKLPSEDERKAFNESIRVIYESTHWFFALEDRARATPGSSETKFLGRLRQLYVRGSGIFEHETDLLISLFSPHDSFFAQHNFPSVANFVLFCANCTMRVETEVNKTRAAFRAINALGNQIKSGMLSLEEVQKRAAELEDPNAEGSVAPLKLDPLLSCIVPLDDSTVRPRGTTS